MFLRNFAVIAAALAAVHCDPEGDAAGRKVAAAEPVAAAPPAPASTPASPAATPTPPAAPVAPAAPDAPAVPVTDDRGGASGAASEFSKCLLACDGATLNHADKAACRYNCDRTPVSGGTGVTDSDPVEYIVACFDRCPADGNAETCLATCKQAVASAPAAPSAAVLDTLGSCLGVCRKARAKETDEATCELNCAQTARLAGPARPLAPAKKGP